MANGVTDKNRRNRTVRSRGLANDSSFRRFDGRSIRRERERAPAGKIAAASRLALSVIL